MKMKDFFDFNSKQSMTNVLASLIDLEYFVEGESTRLNLIKGKYKGIIFPTTLMQKEGKKWTDILNTGYPNHF